jgi:hypothetical protein
MNEDTIWDTLEDELEPFEKKEVIDNKEVPYYLVPIEQTDQLSIGYLSFELYKSLKKLNNIQRSMVGPNSLKHILTKSNIKFIQDSYNPEYIKSLLISLRLKYFYVSTGPFFLYDFYVASLIYEIILWKCLSEYNRHKKAIIEEDWGGRNLHGIVRDMI